MINPALKEKLRFAKMAKRNRSFDTRLNASAGERAEFDEETKKLKMAVIHEGLELSARELELEKQNLDQKLGKNNEDYELENLKEKARKKRKNGEMKILLENYLTNDQYPDVTHPLYSEFMENIGAGGMAPPPPPEIRTPRN